MRGPGCGIASWQGPTRLIGLAFVVAGVICLNLDGR